MRWSTVVLAVLFSLVVVASSAAAVTAVPLPSSSAASAPLALVTDAIPLSTGALPRELPSSIAVSLTFTLTNPRSGELARFLSQVEDPSSPSYRHFLTYPEYVEEFAPPASSVAHVEAALETAGARDITAAPDRSSVTAVLAARSVDQLLGVDLKTYGSANRVPLYTAVGTVSLPPSLDGYVSGIGGLSNSATAGLIGSSRALSPSLPLRPVSGHLAQFAHDNTSGEAWFLGSDYTQAYDVNELFPGAGSVPNATFPTSVAIATLLASAFNQTLQTNLPPWDPAVVAAYFNGTLGPHWPMPNFTGVPVTVDSITPPLPASFGSVNDSTAFETENSLDLEMAGSLAPGASVYNFYFGANLVENAATLGEAADYFAADLAAALSYSYAPRHLATVSCSFGLSDLTDLAWNAELLTAAATGVTVVSASGDQGNAPDSLTGRSDGQWPIWPATDATNTSGSISVGGVSLGLSGSPNAFYNGTGGLNLTYDGADGGISSMSAWYDTLGGQGSYAGTEGGVSPVYPEPLWQFASAAQPAVVNATVLQGALGLGRSGPDVAMPGNATIVTDYANASEGVFFDLLEGTSVAAPVFAGLLADVVAVENNRTTGPWTSLGFLDPEIYRIASFFAAHPGASSDPYLDVTSGSNYVFSAAPGWDPTTGWGGVNAPAFLAADENGTIRTYVYNSSTPGLPPGYPPSPASSAGIPWVFIFAIFGVGIVVAITLVAIGARPSRPRSPPSGVPWGAQGGGPMGPMPTPPQGGYPGSTFLCPYCGAIRPAEPVRCPQCGAF